MNRAFIFFAFTASFFAYRSAAQYAPQVPLPGNEGIIQTSPLFREWASGCTLYRGWLDIADKSLGKASTGTESDVYGPPGAAVLSLGDSGVAVLTFPHSLYNGPGPDFAVFENGFANPVNDTFAFLELAFVEVSSDGNQFFRFPASSLMQDTVQIDNFTYTDTRYYNNLAGKYLSNYGTPFDLEELKDIPGLDIDHITHIRIVDVIGSLNPLYASRDKDGRIINDPYPSPFPSGGFDLRGLGVIHSNAPPTSIAEPLQALQLKVYPNPVADVVHVRSERNELLHYRLTDISGRELQQGAISGSNKSIRMDKETPGVYLLYVDNGIAQRVIKLSKL